MEDGGVVVTSPTHCVVTSRSLHQFVLMTSLVLLLLPSLALSLTCKQYSAPGQKLGFFVKERCANKPVLNHCDDDHHYLVGCTVRVLCTYINTTTDHCSDQQEGAADLAVVPIDNNSTSVIRGMSVVERMPCSVTVEFRKMTTDFQGKYICLDRTADLDSVPPRGRNVVVGRAPVIPRKVRLVYEPKASISLWADPVLRGPELNDLDTTWNASYSWLIKQQQCTKSADKKCKRLNDDGLCRFCFIRLKGKYSGTGQYEGLGSAFNMIKFNITAVNLFGNVSKLKEIYLLSWVRPGPVHNITATLRGSSWLLLKLAAPRDVDQSHWEAITLKYNYTVAMVSPREQSLREPGGRAFHDLYGFVRNLEEDENDLKQENASREFPRSTRLKKWKSARHLSSQHVNVTGLPFAGFWYRFHVQTKARYWGQAVWDDEASHESPPEEGPQLHDNFAYCPLTDSVSAVCLIYFKEVPRAKRGGVIQNHTVTLTLLNGPDLPACPNKARVVTATTGGHNNTLHVPDLCVGGEYEVSLRAVNREGSSPATVRALRVLPTSPDFAARDVVVERAGGSYDIDWKTAAKDNGSAKPKHSVHHCSTVPLQIHEKDSNGSAIPALPFNCVTNMARRGLTAQDTNSTFSAVPNARGLTPAFFVSTATADGQTSNLRPVDCFYAKGKVPAAPASVSVSGVDEDPEALRVTVALPCGPDLSYRNGRPNRYVIAVTRDDDTVEGFCSDHCNQAMNGVEAVVRELLGGVTEGLVHTETGLQADTGYCVGVYLLTAAQRDTRLKDRWTCRTGVTAGKIMAAVSITQGIQWSLAVMGSILVVLVIIFLCTRCCGCYRENRKKFGDNVLPVHALPYSCAGRTGSYDPQHKAPETRVKIPDEDDHDQIPAADDEIPDADVNINIGDEIIQDDDGSEESEDTSEEGEDDNEEEGEDGSGVDERGGEDTPLLEDQSGDPRYRGFQQPAAQHRRQSCESHEKEEEEGNANGGIKDEDRKYNNDNGDDYDEEGEERGKRDRTVDQQGDPTELDVEGKEDREPLLLPQVSTSRKRKQDSFPSDTHTLPPHVRRGVLSESERMVSPFSEPVTLLGPTEQPALSPRPNNKPKNVCLLEQQDTSPRPLPSADEIIQAFEQSKVFSMMNKGSAWNPQQRKRKAEGCGRWDIEDAALEKGSLSHTDCIEMQEYQPAASGLPALSPAKRIPQSTSNPRGLSLEKRATQAPSNPQTLSPAQHMTQAPSSPQTLSPAQHTTQAPSSPQTLSPAKRVPQATSNPQALSPAKHIPQATSNPQALSQEQHIPHATSGLQTPCPARAVKNEQDTGDLETGVEHDSLCVEHILQAGKDTGGLETHGDTQETPGDLETDREPLDSLCMESILQTGAGTGDLETDGEQLDSLCIESILQAVQDRQDFETDRATQETPGDLETDGEQLDSLCVESILQAGQHTGDLETDGEQLDSLCVESILQKGQNTDDLETDGEQVDPLCVESILQAAQNSLMTPPRAAIAGLVAGGQGMQGHGNGGVRSPTHISRTAPQSRGAHPSRDPIHYHDDRHDARAADTQRLADEFAELRTSAAPRSPLLLSDTSQQRPLPSVENIIIAAQGCEPCFSVSYPPISPSEPVGRLGRNKSKGISQRRLSSGSESDESAKETEGESDCVK